MYSRVRAKLSSRIRALRRETSITLFILTAASLAGCIPLTTQEVGSPDVLAKVNSLDLLPRYPQPTSSDTSSSDGLGQPQIFPGTATAIVDPTKPQTAGAGPGYNLNFENTPIATVIKTVIGDILGLGYTIDQRVQGTITLASGRPVPKEQLLFVLEDALRLSNTVLVRQNGGYRVVPVSDAIGAGHVDAQNAEPGYGTSVVPLQNVSARTIAKLLESFATKPGTVRVDTERNLVLIRGTGAERRASIETVLSFDTDWMRGQSVGIFPIRNTVPDQVVADLQKILDTGEGGLSRDVIKLQSIERLNAVLALSRKEALLKTVETWIRRLDKSDIASTGVKVYHVRYGKARQIAHVLNNLFVGNDANNLDAPTNEIAPGSGLTAVSARERLGIGQTGASQKGGGNETKGVGELAANLRVSANKNKDNEGGTNDGQAAGPAILKGVRITADPVTNTLLVYASQENYRIIERTLRQIDRPQLQVAINATIAEVTLNEKLNYGVQFFLNNTKLGIKHPGSATNTYAGANSVNVAGVVGPVLGHVFPGFNFLIGDETQPNLVLDALHDVTTVKVLSNPSVVVLDNEPAVLQVGDEVPVSTGSATVLTGNNTVVNTIDYRNTGVILQVVPRININGNVVLDVQQEISNVSDTSTAGTLTPTVSQRKIKSAIAVASGQTVLLAGLISEREDKSHPTIPGVERVPLLGDALGHTGTTTARTELIIFIRPQIIRNSVDAHFVAEELRAKLRGASQSLEPF
jgi:general secretion pathway protein D